MNLRATFPAGVDELTVNGLHQWDYGRTLEIEATGLPADVELHFACDGMDEAITRTCTRSGTIASAPIPDICLEQASPVTVWVFEIDDASGVTTKKVTLPITPRPKPAQGASIPSELTDSYTELLTAIQDAVVALGAGVVTIGTVESAPYAEVAGWADEAPQAKRAGHADSAGSATSAQYAPTAKHAKHAKHVPLAERAKVADSAFQADHAEEAEYATSATYIKEINEQYLNISGEEVTEREDFLFVKSAGEFIYFTFLTESKKLYTFGPVWLNPNDYARGIKDIYVPHAGGATQMYLHISCPDPDDEIYWVDDLFLGSMIQYRVFVEGEDESGVLIARRLNR